MSGALTANNYGKNAWFEMPICGGRAPVGCRHRRPDCGGPMQRDAIAELVTLPKRWSWGLRLALVLLSVPAGVSAQTIDGAALFVNQCARCHGSDGEPRAPKRDALALRRPEAIIESLVNGAMRVQGSRVSGPERRAIAEFLTGRKVGGDVAGMAEGRCRSQAPMVDLVQSPAWNGWGASLVNTRFQPLSAAPISSFNSRFRP